MGMYLGEYERQVPPANRLFHERAELVLLYRDGMEPTFPLDPDERDEMMPDVDEHTNEYGGRKRLR